jgi:hypothetical protein
MTLGRNNEVTSRMSRKDRTLWTNGTMMVTIKWCESITEIRCQEEEVHQGINPTMISNIKKVGNTKIFQLTARDTSTEKIQGRCILINHLATERSVPEVLEVARWELHRTEGE